MKTITRKLLAVLMAAVMLCLLIPVGAVSAADNPMVNGDFETGDTTGWRVHQTVNVTADAAHDGSYGAHLQDNGTWGGILDQTVPVQAGKSYEISFWIKVNKFGINLQIKDGDASGANLATGTWYDRNGHSEWTQKSYIVAPTTNAIYLNFCGGGGANPDPSKETDTYVDSFVVTELQSSAFDGFIKNGDFETGNMDGWENVWGSCQTEIVDGRNGGSALSITTPGAWQMVRQKVTVKPNTDYEISVYGKDANNVALLVKDGGDTTNMAQTGFAAGADWSETTLEFNSGSYSQVYVCVMGNAANSHIVVDDVSMKELATASNDGYIVNGTFETGELDPWDNLWGSCPKAEIVSGGKGDNYALEVVSGEWKHVRQAGIAVAANTDYQITLWVKNAKNMSLLVKDGGDSDNITNVSVDAGAEWTEKIIEFNSGSYTTILVSFMGNAADAYGTFDNVVMKNLSDPGDEPDQPDTPDTPDEPYVPVEGNFVNNGAFETGDNTGWNLYQKTVVDAAAAKTGSYGLYLQGNGDWGGMGEQVVNGLEIGKTYRISLWYKALSAGVNIQLAAGTNNSGEKLAYVYGTKTEWTQFAVEFEAITTSVCIAFVGSGTYVPEKMYVDDITLTEVVLGGNDDDPNLKMIDTLLDGIKTQGRTAFVGGTLMLDFSISGIEFELNCAGDVYATFNTRKLSSSSTDGGLYFTIIVDGQKLARDYCHLTSVGETKVKLASDLPAGKHTFAIYRQSEHHFGEAGVCALSYEGEMLDKPADKDLYIEFIGDSISCGFGNLGSAAQGDGAALWSDGTQAYTYLTAQALGADWSNVAWSGIGCKYGYGTFSMQEVYPIQRYNYDKTTAYDFSKQPDIVILALGTNDNSIQGNATLKREGLVEMLTLVREKNPNAPIVWIHGMMTTGVSAMIEEIVAEFGGAEAGYYACKLTQNNAGGGAHPNLAGQQTFADELVAFLEENGLGEVETPDIPDTPDVDGDLLSGGETARMEMTDDKLGLAFRFTINAQGVTMSKKHEINLSNATITVDGVEYKLLQVGALVTNDANIGLRPHQFNHDNLSEYTKDVPAVYGNDITEDGLKYAVRVTNIPCEYSEWILYARGYYVYECNGEKVTVYGDVYAANYDDNITTNDGAFDWD